MCIRIVTLALFAVTFCFSGTAQATQLISNETLVIQSIPIAYKADGTLKSVAGGNVDQDGSELATDFESGSLGEPFSVSAVFQECDAIDGSQYCAFHAEGWKWYAWFGGGTSDRLLGAMQKLSSGDLLDVSGDIISYGDITTEVAVARITLHGPRDELENTTAGIQGKWGSSDDPQARMVIVGGEIHEYYGAEFLETNFFRITNQCDEGSGAGPFLIKRTPETQSSDCYVILGWDAEVLQLSYIGGAGSGDLTYEKEY